MYAFLTAVITSVLASLVLGITTLLFKYRRLAEFRLLPGPRPNFLFGNAWELPTHSEGKRRNMYLKTSDALQHGQYKLKMETADRRLQTGYKISAVVGVLNDIGV